MNRQYIWLVPLFLMLGFADYYFVYWEPPEHDPIKLQEPVARARLAAAISEMSGDAYVGRDGGKEAEIDIQKNQPRLLYYGKTPVIKERTEVFGRRFGVKYEGIAGCMLNDPVVAYADAYNSVIKRYIALKFGEHALVDAQAEASEIWERQRKKG